MATSELGKKRACQGCGASFYDLNKKPIACPKCDVEFKPEPPARPKRPTAAAVPAPVAEIKPTSDPDKTAEDTPGDDDDDDDVLAAGDDGVSVDLDDDDKDDDLIEDTSELGETDDDMSEVKEHIDDGVGDKGEGPSN
ncbi:MAG: TIGR02300 family protein [Rhodospirillales bacterium]|nr:TIGR02300 family protein [Rhodospirillales bacterium]